MLRNLFGKYGPRKAGFYCAAAAGLFLLLVTVSNSGVRGVELDLPSLDSRVSVSFQSDFEILINNTFRRTSPEIQIACRRWADKFTARYGEEVFDSLIERFITTKTYQQLRREAESLQSTDEAHKLASRVTALAYQVPVLWKRYRDLKREAQDVSLFSGLERDMALRHRIEDEARRAFEDYLEIYQRHNRLVADYNKKYLGGLEFFTDHLEGFSEGLQGSSGQHELERY